VEILFNYLDQTQRCNSRLYLFESQLRASTSTGSNSGHQGPEPAASSPFSGGARSGSGWRRVRKWHFQSCREQADRIRKRWQRPAAAATVTVM
jgi:hypothetical protein